MVGREKSNDSRLSNAQLTLFPRLRSYPQVSIRPVLLEQQQLTPQSKGQSQNDGHRMPQFESSVEENRRVSPVRIARVVGEVPPRVACPAHGLSLRLDAHFRSRLMSEHPRSRLIAQSAYWFSRLHSVFWALSF